MADSHLQPLEICGHIGTLELQAHVASLRWRTRRRRLPWVSLPRAGLHHFVSAVSSKNATRSASLPPTLLCWGTHDLMSTLLTAPAERMATMVKHTMSNRRAVLRRDQRALLGRLRDRIVNSKTQLRYERACHTFFCFSRARRASPMCTSSWFDPLHFDSALCSFIESLWEEGDSRNEAIDCVSGVLHYLPQLKGKVGLRRSTLSLWQHLRVKPSP